MADTLTVNKSLGILSAMAAEQFKNETPFCQSISKEADDTWNGKAKQFKAGDTIYINKPARTIPTTNRDITSDIQEHTEETVPLALDIDRVVATDLTAEQLTTDVDPAKVYSRFLKDQISSLAQHVEQEMVKRATQATYNSVGTAGSNTFDVPTILSAKTKMSKFLCPKDAMRTLLLDSDAGALAIDARKGLFQSSSEIKKQYEQGIIGRADGFEWRESEILYDHTNGNDVSFEVRTTVATEGQSTLVVEGLNTTTGTVTKGTVFTIDTVYAVNPVTKQVYNYLQQFTVTADATADGSGYATLSISPAIYTSASDGLQNVSAFPADGDTCNVVGSASTAYLQSLAYHKNAFRMASVPLALPTSAEFAQTVNKDGMSLTIVRGYDIRTTQFITRIDFLGGIAAVRPEWSCRITA